MKRDLLISLGSFVFGSVVAMAAENATILESFESSIESVTQGTWGGPRIPDGVALNLYTRTGEEDSNVTHGTNSLQVNLSLSEDWVNDFMITLSEEASDKVRQAAASTDVARYILRYDIIFPGGNSWMNNQAFLGEPAINNQLNTPSGSSGGKATMSWPLDLVEGLSESGPIVLRFADNFDSTEDPFVGPLSVYVDNLRIVDTYAPGATPITYMLQNFEGSNGTGGAADEGATSRTTYSQYIKADAEDLRVTEGTNSLKVTYTPAFNGEWRSDFILPFADTKLAEILKLDRPAEERPSAEELARYTMRYDIIFPDRDENNKPGWATTQQYAHSGSWLPFSENRRDLPAGRVQTVSFTLDTLPSWGDNVPAAPGVPVMVFVAQVDKDTPFDLWYDNFRLIDTGATGATQPEITAIKVDAGKIIITWTGDANLQFTTSLQGKPTWTTLSGITSGTPLTPPPGGVAFYRVAAQ